ncbi:MAG: carboxypeptidase-like regulatory domain-containing protein, partial [Methanoregula sp.]|nr:carboxypeptidase-like regulatory domain-containing protein [Methanoregula sp.]
VNLTVSDFYGTDTASAPVSMSACTGNLSTFFYYPVSVIDAVTGYPIAESWLNVAQLDTGEWYNISSHTGNFTISGKGTLGTTKLEIYDVLTLTGNATGYFDDGFNLIVDESNNGIEQFLSLVPGTDAPKPGDFIVVFTVEDAETSSSLPGVSIQVNGTTKQTNAGGSVMFKNLTGGTTYQYTASKYAYTTITGSFTNTSSMVKYVDVIMNRETAPTPTVTVPTATPTNIPSTYPTSPGQTPTVTPTGVPGSYSGAFGGIENALAEWGVSPTEMGIVLAAILILLGFLLGGFVSAPAFNPMTGLAGATLGLLFAIAFGFLGIIYIIALILSAAFIAIFFLSR